MLHRRIFATLVAALVGTGCNDDIDFGFGDWEADVDTVTLYSVDRPEYQGLPSAYDIRSRRTQRVEDAAVNGLKDPWQQVEATLVAHLDAILDQSDYARVLISVRPDQVPEVSMALRALRERYEKHFRSQIDALPLPRGTDRHLLRLMLIGAANWAQIWYRPGGQSPAGIAKAFVDFLRKPLQR